MSLIGVGGTADVWRAHDERRGRTVTLKILRERDDPAIRRAFLAEAEILDSLTHPGSFPFSASTTRSGSPPSSSPTSTANRLPRSLSGDRSRDAKWPASSSSSVARSPASTVVASCISI